MNYLESAANLKSLIEKANIQLLASNEAKLQEPNKALLRTNFGKEVSLPMEEFTNSFVQKILSEYESEAIVISDFVATRENDKELHYFLYKGYHKLFNKGLVYYQLVNKATYEPIGELQFSNIEDNIFYSVEEPKDEESSCNAVETKENTVKNPSIAFLIGHMNEERLLFDINRLIFETANNVQKHKGRNFTFHIQVSKFGGTVKREFIKQLDRLKTDIDKYIHSTYPNSQFILDLDELK
ncbi:hypothetical protein [Saccharicrinis aurantiacus]|uniref:hypothetical protein n=1 Tax=Saccharicrinis aurantiacus TaxID=1849719 RepID=UPI0008396CC3|nr:hypothetical protein [Saccharicrinis aurantiacus]